MLAIAVLGILSGAIIAIVAAASLLIGGVVLLALRGEGQRLDLRSPALSRH